MTSSHRNGKKPDTAHTKSLRTAFSVRVRVQVLAQNDLQMHVVIVIWLPGHCGALKIDQGD